MGTGERLSHSEDVCGRIEEQGIAAFRYNGSMVDVGADTYLYRWKKMIGPIDERRVTLRSGFNLYATHSFGFEKDAASSRSD